MKAKSIFITTLLSLFIVSGLWAQNGERVYIRQFSLGTMGKTTIVIYEKGDAKELEIENIFSKKGDSLKSLSEILEKYFKQGYKMIGTTNGGGMYVSEYILEKQ